MWPQLQNLTPVSHPVQRGGRDGSSHWLLSPLGGLSSRSWLQPHLTGMRRVNWQINRSSLWSPDFPNKQLMHIQQQTTWSPHLSVDYQALCLSLSSWSKEKLRHWLPGALLVTGTVVDTRLPGAPKEAQRGTKNQGKMQKSTATLKSAGQPYSTSLLVFLRCLSLLQLSSRLFTQPDPS